MMKVKVSDLLNEDEKKMLAELIKTQPHQAQSQQVRNYDLVSCQMSSKLKDCLVNGTNIGLVIHHEHYDVIYPIFCSFDDKGQEIIDVHIPEITEKSSAVGRDWRAKNTYSIGAFNESNDSAQGTIRNVSLSGVYIQCDFEILDKVRQKTHLGDLLKPTGSDTVLRIKPQSD